MQEASGKTSNLSRADRAVLKEIDGKTALQNIAVKFDKESNAHFTLGAVFWKRQMVSEAISHWKRELELEDRKSTRLNSSHRP